ncbi:hypothetical protein SS50377_26458 [Spironucleus salmonicida]|uniref:Uncharacterized protein n=1 Tax=Spironucleus salmonicida TaxID=348837 RepID=V6LAR9_9EUKA|nr:hypothetical protein SS50377_26458 [Spironucleus salmonicida]|eukprot:EST41318.1 Hypothetical protein SS50377_19030 [Spironucleus salmonicida]
MLITMLSYHLPNCYNQATAQYNQNLKTVQLNLQPLQNPDCLFLVDEVIFQLNFHDKFRSVKFIKSHFNFTSTQMIVMEKIDILNDDSDGLTMPLHATLNISNLAFWTEVRVAYVGRQAAQMDQCFYQAGSQFEIKEDRFEFRLNLSDACYTEIFTESKQFQYQLNQKAATVKIIRFIDDPDNFNCQMDQVQRVYFCTQLGDFSDDLTIPFTQASVKFFINYLGILYTTEIQFNEVVVGHIKTLFSSINPSFYRDMMQVSFTYSQNALQNWKMLTQASDLFISRLNILGPNFTQSFQIESPQFDETILILTEKCKDQICLDSMVYINENMAQFQFYFDISAYSGDKIDGTSGQIFTASAACVNRVLTKTYSSTKVCFLVIKSDFFTTNSNCFLFADGEPTNITAVSLDTTTLHVGKFCKTQQVNFSFANPTICFDCLDCIIEITDFAQSRMSAFIYTLEQYQFHWHGDINLESQYCSYDGCYFHNRMHFCILLPH